MEVEDETKQNEAMHLQEKKGVRQKLSSSSFIF